MRADVRSALRFLRLPTLALIGIAVFLPGRLELAIRVYALLLSGIALLLVLAALRRAYPPAAALRPPPGRAPVARRPGTLSRLEHVSALGVAGAFDLHHRLRPRLRGVASGLLMARRRVSLDAEPEIARAVLGEETFELVRPDRRPPEDRRARGLPVEDLRRVVESLERV